jgi:hypothetical protein
MREPKTKQKFTKFVNSLNFLHLLSLNPMNRPSFSIKSTNKKINKENPQKHFYKYLLFRHYHLEMLNNTKNSSLTKQAILANKNINLKQDTFNMKGHYCLRQKKIIKVFFICLFKNKNARK